jgi:exonuclease SbcD
MLIAIAADLHLNNTTYGRMSEDGLPIKTQDAFDALTFIVDECIDRKVDRLIVVGDIFENHFPPNHMRRLLNAQLQRLLRKNIEVILMVGNHDVCRDHHALMPIYGWDDRIRVVDKVLHEKKDKEGFVASYLPHTNDIESRKTTFREEVHKIVELASKDRKGKKYLFFGHFGVQGSYQNDACINVSSNDVTVRELEALNADAVFLGHFHKPQSLSNKKRIFYVGSAERNDFNEMYQDKGFIIYDTKSDEIERVVYDDVRKMAEINASNFDELMEAIEKADFDEHIVRIVFDGEKEDYIDTKEKSNIIKKAIMSKGACHFTGIVDKSEGTEEAVIELTDKMSRDVVSIIEAQIEKDFPEEEEMKEMMALFSQIKQEAMDKGAKSE